MVWELRERFLEPHIDAERVTSFFREQHNIDKFALLEQNARVGVPVNVGPGGNLERELAYRRNSGVNKHASEVWGKAVGDVKSGRAIVLTARLAGMVRGLRINPLGVVEE